MFTVSCGKCDNKIYLKDGENGTKKEEINIIETRSKYHIKIKCECDNEIWLGISY